MLHAVARFWTALILLLLRCCSQSAGESVDASLDTRLASARTVLPHTAVGSVFALCRTLHEAVTTQLLQEDELALELMPAELEVRVAQLYERVALLTAAMGHDGSDGESDAEMET